MTLSVVPLYAGLLAFMYVGLSARVILMRRKSGIVLGDSGDITLTRRQRVHANFAEYAPLALVLLLMTELQGASFLVLHALGVLLIAGRVLHAYGVSQEQESAPFLHRVMGMALTFGVILIASLMNIASVFPAFS